MNASEQETDRQIARQQHFKCVFQFANTLARLGNLQLPIIKFPLTVTQLKRDLSKYWDADGQM